MRVFVYFNLHLRCFSIKALEGVNKGRVIAHKHEVQLYDCTYKVSEAGRQRVLREQRKNVHAGVCGTWLGDVTPSVIERYASMGTRVTYNPYKYSTFVNRVTELPILKSRSATMLVAPNANGIKVGYIYSLSL
jgi:hypothetical protein